MENNSDSYNGKYNDIRKITEDFTIRLTDTALYDRLHTLAAEYSVPVELLADTAVKQLLEEVDLLRSLRAGRLERK